MSTGDVYRGDLSDLSAKDLRDASNAIGADRTGIKANAKSKIPLIGGEHLYVNGEGYRIKKGKTIFGTEHMQLCKDDPAGTVLVNVPYDIDTTDDEAISAIQRELAGEMYDRLDDVDDDDTVTSSSGGGELLAAIINWALEYKYEKDKAKLPPPNPGDRVDIDVMFIRPPKDPADVWSRLRERHAERRGSEEEREIEYAISEARRNEVNEHDLNRGRTLYVHPDWTEYYDFEVLHEAGLKLEEPGIFDTLVRNMIENMDEMGNPKEGTLVKFYAHDRFVEVRYGGTLMTRLNSVVLCAHNEKKDGTTRMEEIIGVEFMAPKDDGFVALKKLKEVLFKAEGKKCIAKYLGR